MLHLGNLGLGGQNHGLGNTCPMDQILGRMGVLSTSLGCSHTNHGGTGHWIYAKETSVDGAGMWYLAKPAVGM